MAKNQFIRARVAGWEKDCIRRKADAAHMTESEFVRRAAMDREVTVIEGMDELLRELRYQGNNLNQLTVMARQGRITQVNYEPFTEVYRNAWQTLYSLLSQAVCAVSWTMLQTVRKRWSVSYPVSTAWLKQLRMNSKQ